jgi:Cellulase (glycosyl hydrolase family 5)
VAGNQVVTLEDEPLTLRGVNLPGLDAQVPDETGGFRAGAGLTDAVLDTLCGWGANLVRVAVNRSRVLDGYGSFSPWDYVDELDRIVAAASARGAYTMLSLRRLDETAVFGTVPGDGERALNQTAPQPDYDTIGMWRLLGEHYGDEPAVLFDLYTSPRPALPDDLSGMHSDWDLWTLWARLAVAELRREHPRALCVVSGHEAGTDLSGLPLEGSTGPIPNLVYSARMTPKDAPAWQALRTLAARHPVLITEWTANDLDIAWAERTAQGLRADGLGWTAGGGERSLLRSERSRLEPTRFGAVVQRALAVTGERVPTPARALSVPSREGALGHGNW